jgi:hypothetical protein
MNCKNISILLIVISQFVESTQTHAAILMIYKQKSSHHHESNAITIQKKKIKTEHF